MGFRRPESPPIDAMPCYAAKPDNCCGGTFTRLVNAFTGCTEDGLQHQLRGGLHRPVPYRRDGQRQLHTNTVSFWDGQRSGIPFTHFGAKASQYLRHGV